MSDGKARGCRNSASPATARRRWLLIWACTIVLAGCAQNPIVIDKTRSYRSSADLRSQAENGDVRAQRDLGLLELVGTAVPKNTADGVKWLASASAKGDAEAAFRLGASYQGGLLLPRNDEEAAKWFKLSAERGYAPAQNAYGYLFDHGQGLPQNYAEALKWYRLAVAQNNPAAQNNLGIMHTAGHGVPVDHAEAVRLYRLSARQKHPFGQGDLASAYETGRGVEKDPVMAYAWYDLAVASSNAAQRPAMILARDRVAKLLSPAELAQGQQMATVWNPGSDVVSPSEAVAAVVAAPTPGNPSSGAAAPGNQTASNPGAAATPSPGSAAAARTRISIGTGFVVGKSGQIVTNAHVVAERCTEVRVHVAGQEGIAAPALAIDRTSDLAVLSGVLPTLRPLPFRQSGPRAGDAVLTYGFPLAPILSTEGNVTTGNITALAGLANNSQMLQISAPVQPGNSGGPLVDLSGAVLGVVSQKLNTVAVAAASGDIAQNVNFAIKAGIVEGFLDANNVPYTTTPAGADQKPADVAERIKKSTVMVECWR